jgi:SAM-dependent methyltransferase
MSFIPGNEARLAALAAAYDFDAAERSKRVMGWRDEIIDRWAGGLEPGARILELGAGTGQAAARLETQGFHVTALDLSPENVARCRERGLAAAVADVGRIEDITDPVFQPPYDAAFAFNSLIHFPKAELDAALTSIRSALVPGAPLMFTLWGGESFEGIWEADWTEPKRFFAYYDDAEAEALQFTSFERTALTILDNADELGLHSQIFELRAL